MRTPQSVQLAAAAVLAVGVVLTPVAAFADIDDYREISEGVAFECVDGRQAAAVTLSIDAEPELPPRVDFLEVLLFSDHDEGEQIQRWLVPDPELPNGGLVWEHGWELAGDSPRVYTLQVWEQGEDIEPNLILDEEYAVGEACGQPAPHPTPTPVPTNPAGPRIDTGDVVGAGGAGAAGAGLLAAGVAGIAALGFAVRRRGTSER